MFATEDLQQARMSICENCPELINLTRCKKCGCYMKLKVRILWAKCPMDKWPDHETWTTKNLKENCQK